MKRLALLILFLLLAAGAFAATKLTIDPSTMKDGETKTLVDGDKTINVTRKGDALDIRIEGGGKTRTVTINRADGDITINRDGYAFRMPAMPRLAIDHARPPRAQTWFVCPKDHTILRVPSDKADQTWKCPVDGTTMEKRQGRGMVMFFDSLESSDDV